MYRYTHRENGLRYGCYLAAFCYNEVNRLGGVIIRVKNTDKNS